MLPNHFRLTRMKDFENLFKEGWFVGANLLTAKIWKIDPAKYPRRNYSADDLKIGFVVSVKTTKKAVERNRMKRQMREVVRLLLKEDRIERGYMILFIAKKEMLGAEYADIEQNIQFVLKRARLLK